MSRVRAFRVDDVGVFVTLFLSFSPLLRFRGGELRILVVYGRCGKGEICYSFFLLWSFDSAAFGGLDRLRGIRRG